MRKNYYELQKAYYLLLGYKWEETEQSRLVTELKGKDNLRVTSPSENSYGLTSTLKKSAFVELNDTNSEMEDMRAKIPKLTQSFIQV